MNSREFDYIVVGAGAAGCVVAARLAEDPSAQVLLLEEGPDDKTIFIKANGGFFKTHGTNRTFLFETEPEPGLRNRKIPLLQGRTLGGGTSINAMCYTRGQAEDYDGWAAQGLKGWSYADVLPYFRKAESNVTLAGEYHGTNGPLQVSDLVHRHILSEAFVRATQETTLPDSNEPVRYNHDFNGEKQDGAGFYQIMSRNGERFSTARSYLSSAGRNLVVRSSAGVRRIVLEDRRAIGVEVASKGGRSEIIRCRKEIILSAGSFMSPKILMLSGIGPAEELRRHGIEVIVDSPNVGRNYQDHLLAPVDVNLKEPISFIGQDRGWNAIRNVMQWLFFRTGPLASNVCEAGGFFDLDRDGRPEIQLNAIPVATTAWGEGAPAVHCLAVSPFALTCNSRGTITLNSSDPLDKPVVRGNFIHDIEIASLVRGIQLSRRILRAPTLAPFIKDEALPGPGVGDSFDELADYVRSNAKTAIHPTSTCAMGIEADAVTDAELKVRGVEGLRIADGSVMPQIVRGNTTAPIVMIGERAADLIRNRTGDSRRVA